MVDRPLLDNLGNLGALRLRLGNLLGDPWHEIHPTKPIGHLAGFRGVNPTVEKLPCDLSEKMI